jgi:hypothetical protein
MPGWLKIVLCFLALTAATLLAGVLGAYRTRRKLRSLFAGRNEASAYQSCLTAFSEIDESRVRLAYRWVQELVSLPNALIHADDDLWKDLRIDQGDADNLFECAHEWRRESAATENVSLTKPPETVEDLMREVLAYEGYVETLRRKSSQTSPGIPREQGQDAP